MHIFSTCGTSTCKHRIIVCNGNLARHDCTHSGDGFQIVFCIGICATRMLPLVLIDLLNGDAALLVGDVLLTVLKSASPFVISVIADDGSATAISFISCGVGCADSRFVICPIPEIK